MRRLTLAITSTVVVVVMVVGVMIPITASLDDNIKSVKQNTSERFFVTDDNLELTVIRQDDNSYLINGKPITGSSETYIISDKFFIQLRIGGYMIRDLDDGTNWNGTSFGEIITVTRDGAYNYIKAGTTKTGTVETLLYPDPSGNYGCYVNTTITVNSDDVIYAMYRTDGSIVKTIVNGETGADLIPNSGTGQMELTYTVTPTDDELGYTYSNIQFTTESGTGGAVVYAPWKYSTIDASAEGIKQIVGILPIIIILGLIAAIGYMIMTMRELKDI